MTASASTERQVQYICTSKPSCKCASDDNEWDECCCVRGSQGFCQMCLAPMVLIDFETGKPPTS